MKPLLVYIIDPYCGWCFGNRSIINEVYAHYKDSLEFRVIPAGMWAGSRKRLVTPELRKLLKYYADRIGETTDNLFKAPYLNLLNKDSLVLDSEIPGRALLTIDKFWRSKAISYCDLLFGALYQEGKNLSEESTYVELAESVHLSSEEFLKLFYSDEMRAYTQNVFLKILPEPFEYPAIFLVDRIGCSHPISEGYTRFSVIDRQLQEYLK